MLESNAKCAVPNPKVNGHFQSLGQGALIAPSPDRPVSSLSQEPVEQAGPALPFMSMSHSYQRVAGEAARDAYSRLRRWSGHQEAPGAAPWTGNLKATFVFAISGLLLLLLYYSSSSRLSLFMSASSLPADAGISFAVLQERLRELEDRPLLSRDEMVTLNLQGCPEGIFRREAQAHVSEWRKMSIDHIRALRQKMVDHLRSLDQDEVIHKLQNRGSKSRGIVLAGGNAHTLDRLEANLRFLRESIQTGLPVPDVDMSLCRPRPYIFLRFISFILRTNCKTRPHARD